MQRYQAATREQVAALLSDTLADSGRGAKKKWTFKKIVSTTLSFLVILILMFVLAMLIKTKMEGGYPELFGYRIFRVETGSMIPTLPIGSVLLVHKPDDPASLKVGTVITYRYETAVVTHRVVDIEYETDEETGEKVVRYRTQGDNPENTLDPWRVKPEDILGELIWNFSL